ncbi:MAG: DUF488 domain-containing protein [Candidatus Bathyarchaeota archaeon]
MVTPALTVYTIGHSTRKMREFFKVLSSYHIKSVIDVRRFPTSSKFPWFNKDNLSKRLGNLGINYFHLPELGGFRRGGYKTFMKTPEFKVGIKKLLKILEENKGSIAIMCSEKFFWRCHRRFIADFLTNLGFEVNHILNGKVYRHKLKL